jgi:rubrerythrin
MNMKNLKGTKTAENLLKAFAGESQAMNRYLMYADVAKKEGYVQISKIFTETAENEKQHARRFFRFLSADEEVNNTAIEINAGYPVFVGDTHSNLIAAAAGENEEWTELYPEFADVADEEGFKDVAAVFRIIASIEKHHEERYKTLAQNVKDESVFKKTNKVYWKCDKCGYIHEASEAVKVCPSCQHPQAYFEILTETY